MGEEREQSLGTWSPDAFTLHLFAMGTMLLDHIGASLFPGAMWLRCIGRLAFPLFAFFAAEGALRTKDIKRYALRLLVCGIVSEIPFDMMGFGCLFYWGHQNVLWTLLLGVLCVGALEWLRRNKPGMALWALGGAAVIVLGYVCGVLLQTDYSGWGVMFVVVFYLLRGDDWPRRLGQAACLLLLNAVALGSAKISLVLWGVAFALPVQSLALLSLPLIWWYRGRQGVHNRAVRWLFYAFYPAHLLVLGLLRRYL